MDFGYKVTLTRLNNFWCAHSVLIMLALIFVLTFVAGERIQGKELTKDAKSNAIASFHLWTTGSISSEDHSLTYEREPLPIAITAAHMALFVDIPKMVTLDALNRDLRYTKQILRGNIYYVIGLFFALWWLAWQLTRSNAIGALAIIGSARFFVSGYVDELYTELPAALFITLAASVAIWLFQKRRLSTALLLGAALGAVALTKAVGLYVALVAIPVLAAALIGFKLVNLHRAATIFAVIVVGFAVTITPWMARNYLNFGEFAIAQRGGSVLLTRAVKNGMTAEEYRAAFYVYAPRGIQRTLFETVLGCAKKDLEPGGRYVRLIRYQPGEREALEAGNFEHLTSYYVKRMAMRAQFENELRGKGLPLSHADQMEQETAMKMIKADLGRHLMTTIPFAWRGIWSFYHAKEISIPFFIAFLALPIISIWRNRSEWFALSLLGGGFFWFYAFLTHFIPRYSAPLIPLAIVSVLVLANDLYLHRKQVRSDEA